MIRSLARKAPVLLMGITLGATLASLIPLRAWPLEFLASFRVQITSLCLVSALLAFLLRMRLWGTVAVLMAAFQIALLFPLFVSAERWSETASTSDRDAFTVLTLNLDRSNRMGGEVIRLLREQDADIVALQEVDGWWKRELACLRDKYPHQTFDGCTSSPCVGVLSRIEPARVKWHSLYGRAFVSLLLQRNANRFRFLAVHTFPPRTPYLYRVRNLQIDEIARRASHDPRPVILAGDLNATPWSPVLRDLERTTRLSSVRAGKGTLPTWPTWNRMLGIPIDHIYHGESFAPESVRRVTVPGSDHSGLLARFVPADRIH